MRRELPSRYRRRHFCTARSCPRMRMGRSWSSTVSGVIFMFSLPLSRMPRMLMPYFFRRSSCRTVRPAHSPGMESSKME